jgi:hypothetical protein
LGGLSAFEAVTGVQVQGGQAGCAQRDGSGSAVAEAVDRGC